MFAIELESTKNGLLVLQAGGGVHGTIDFYPPRGNVRASLPVTPEQFRKFSYDIEAHAEAKYGIKLADLEIYAVNLETKQRERISYADALAVLAALDDPKAAAAVEAAQAAQAAELAAEVERRKAARAGADGEAEPAAAVGALPTPPDGGANLAALMAEAAARAGAPGA